MSSKRLASVVALISLAAVVLAGCSTASDDSNSDSSRVTLTIGDQVQTVRSLLEASGELKDLPYDVKWAEFESGPPLLEAAAANKIDIGGTGDVPAVFAQAGGAPLKIVGVQARTKANDFLLVPSNSSAKSITDLKGKKVAFTKGTSAHGLVLALLDQAKLKPEDIEATYLSPAEALSAFSSGQVDAWAVWNPFATVGQAQAGGKVIGDSGGLTTQQLYFQASEAALNDSAKNNAIKDFIARLARANVWSVTNEDKWIPTFSKLTKLPEPIARATFATSSGPLAPINDAVIAKQQRLIDLFAGAGELPKSVEAKAYFDDRFNDAVTETGAP